jgi:adenosylcobinamide amidohydrolase
VVKDYGRLDPDVHLRELAASLGLAGEGTGMLTAVDVGNATSASDGGVAVVATVGLGYPTWAAAENDAPAPVAGPGTINILAYIPAPLTDAALVNTVATATEAKVQALLGNGANCTGTATDALFIATPIAAAGEELESFGGPRSRWGACLARAVFEAVGTGTQEWRRRGTS